MTIKPARWLIVLAAVMVALAGCASSAGTPAPSTAAPPAAAPSTSITGPLSLLPPPTASPTSTPATVAETKYCVTHGTGTDGNIDTYYTKTTQTVAFKVKSTDLGSELWSPSWRHFTYIELPADKSAPYSSFGIRIEANDQGLYLGPMAFLDQFHGKAHAKAQKAYLAFWHAYAIDHWANDLCEVTLCG